MTGLLDTNVARYLLGGRYNPSTDSWSPINTYNVWDARGGHAAVWTGTEMIVWGGFGTHEHTARALPSGD